MRLNKFLSQATQLSRRKADEAIVAGRVTVNESIATLGQTIQQTDTIALDGKLVKITRPTATLMINKPIGYVCSRRGQGSKTVYDLVPDEYQHLNLVGRLDKNSSGLLLLTNDGELANQLTHPKFNKQKIYEVKLNKSLKPVDLEVITTTGVVLEDGLSKLGLENISGDKKTWRVTMSEGRNRQIRRTFEALDYEVKGLHRTNFGKYKLDSLNNGRFSVIISDS